jgi:DNA-binding NarL/FixJ family response regulator
VGFCSAYVSYTTYSDGCIESSLKTLDIYLLMAKSVLIADDSVSVRYVIRSFLKDVADIEICGEAVDGLEAVEKAKKLKPDLVLLDLSMPTMNGVEVASILKKTMPQVLIILFTMYSENIGKALTSAVGVDAVLSKPDGMGQLVESIKALLATSHNNSPAARLRTKLGT